MSKSIPPNPWVVYCVTDVTMLWGLGDFFPPIVTDPLNSVTLKGKHQKDCDTTHYNSCIANKWLHK